MTPQSAQTAPFVRRNAWTLPSGDTTLEEYASAVAIMQGRSATDPTSWSYQAAMHGTHATQNRPLWNGCQHGTWFFLSWHRMYLYYFERIVRAAVVQAGGSADWALPFWDYGAGGQQAKIPAAFRHANIGGQHNPLFVSQRAPGINTGHALPSPVRSAAGALSRPRFTGITQFGGGITTPQQFASSTGQLEQTPHNDVHGVVGGNNGWMADVLMAAQDPIFWLHHCNIDRLWHVWNRNNPQAHKDPRDTRWTTHQFSFFDADGSQVHKTAAEVVDTRRQLGYVYETGSGETAPAPGAREEEEVAVSASGGPPEEEEREPELVGASDASVQLIGGPARVALEVDPKAKDAVLREARTAEPEHIYLSVEDIDAERNPGTVYGIYVNLPEDASPEVAERHHAGNVSFFGVEAARKPAGDAPAHSLRVTTEITELVHELTARGEWDGQHVTVTFRPFGLIPPDDAERSAHALPESMPSTDPPVTIGRVSISYG
jgi:tyrosinase